MRYIMQRYGDRGSNLASLRERCHTIPANPMSDRGQMVIEVYEIQVEEDIDREVQAENSEEE